MKKNQELKAQVVEEIVERLRNSQSVVFVDYRGLTVAEDTELRGQFRQAGVEYKVYKNTLLKRALDIVGIEGLDDALEGPTAVCFGVSDAVAPAKVITEYIKKTKKTTVKAGIVEGNAIDAQGVQALADLPPREVLIARILGSLNAPITGLVTVLGGTLRSLLYAINAVKEQKEKEGTAA